MNTRSFCLSSSSVDDLPKLVEDIVQTSINTDGPRYSSSHWCWWSVAIRMITDSVFPAAELLPLNRDRLSKLLEDGERIGSYFHANLFANFLDYYDADEGDFRDKNDEEDIGTNDTKKIEDEYEKTECPRLSVEAEADQDHDQPRILRMV
ncbi:hypothetical protein E3N88_38589 [Mikania micrantha]|uniref:Uncharacterized protein n=1 Tax=Mikania micrantha TaxID=192012 RepID=A0A5N6LWY8_9ASTR|nr:hypothetical protein E3N88_38589 [Mikania micrantha]